MFFRQIFDPDLAQYAYLIGCQATGEAIVIDPERDIDRYLAVAAEEDLRIVAAAETHIHADFLSGVRTLVEDQGVTGYLSGEGGPDWSYGWVERCRGEVRLLKDGQVFQVGNIRFETVHTPGHTPEHLSFLVTDLGGGAAAPMGIVSGDFVFVGDLGRPDLLETAAGATGSREPAARALFASTADFLALPDHVQVWPGHGAGSACGKALGAVPQSTVGYERRFNAALSLRDEGRFVDAILDGQPEPPPYFARMKILNRDGPPWLERLPTPQEIPAARAVDDALRNGVVVVDTRDRSVFAAGHVPGSIHAPLGTAFPLVAGSYLDPEADLVLVVEPEAVDRAVRVLVRIGYDRVIGYLTPDALAVADGLASIPRVAMDRFDPATRPEATLLDVRGAAEHEGATMPGAKNIAHTRLASRLAEVPREAPVVVYCRSGARASAASSFLAREGFDVTIVDGLLADWPGEVVAGAGETT